MLTTNEKLELIKSFRGYATKYQKELALVLEALQTDVLDEGHRFEDLYVATMSHYG